MAIELEDFIESVNKNFETVKNISDIFGNLDDVQEDNDSHRNYSVYEHTNRVYQNALFFINFISSILHKKFSFNERSRSLFLLKCLLHDIGKIDTGIYIGKEKVFPKHELRSSELAKTILEKLELTSKEREEVVGFIKDHSDIHICLDGGIDEFHERLNNFEKTHDKTQDFITFCLADIYGSHLEKSDRNEYLYRINTLLNAL